MAGRSVRDVARDVLRARPAGAGAPREARRTDRTRRATSRRWTRSWPTGRTPRGRAAEQFHGAWAARSTPCSTRTRSDRRDGSAHDHGGALALSCGMTSPRPPRPASRSPSGRRARAASRTIAMLEALDELGLRPSRDRRHQHRGHRGAAYASGVSGKGSARPMRCLAAARPRPGDVARAAGARRQAHGPVLRLGNPVLVDGEKLLDLVWPEAVPDAIEDLAIPFQAVATTITPRRALRFASGTAGERRRGLHGDPGLVRPVLAGGRVFIDGGAVNPLAFEGMDGPGTVVIAVDVTADRSPTTRPPRRRSRPCWAHRRSCRARSWPRS